MQARVPSETLGLRFTSSPAYFIPVYAGCANSLNGRQRCTLIVCHSRAGGNPVALHSSPSSKPSSFPCRRESRAKRWDYASLHHQPTSSRFTRADNAAFPHYGSSVAKIWPLPAVTHRYHLFPQFSVNPISRKKDFAREKSFPLGAKGFRLVSLMMVYFFLLTSDFHVIALMRIR